MVKIKTKSMVETRQQDPKLSIWEKSQERSYAKKYLHGNFNSGHKMPNEHYLSRAGLRGRKRWLCLALFVIVYLFALAHLVLTCVVLGVLRFNFGGSPYLVFQDDNSLTWPEGASLTNVRLASPSSVHGYNNQSLTFSGQQDDQITFQASTSARFSIDSSSVNLSTESLQTVSRNALSVRQLQLSVSESLVEMEELISANSLRTSRATTNTVKNVSEIQADGQLALSGATGVSISGSQFDIAANGNVVISSQGNIVINGRVVMSSLPSPTPRTGGLRYHLCACASGRLFVTESNAQRCGGANTNTMCT